MFEEVFGWSIGIAIAMLISLTLMVLSLIFWVDMLIDCLKRKFKKDIDKIVWTLVIIFTGILGAVIYYFVVKKK